MSRSIGLIGITYFLHQADEIAVDRQKALYRTKMLLSGGFLQRAEVDSLQETLEPYSGASGRELRDVEWYFYAGALIRPADGTYETIQAHLGRINALVLLPGGRRLASAGRDQAIHLWDVFSRERVGTLGTHDRQIFALAASPDGSAIASGGLAGDLRIWRADVRTIASPTPRNHLREGY